MKQLKHFVLTVLVELVGNISASAYEFEVDGIYYNVLSLEDLTCEVTYMKSEGYKFYSPYEDEVVIPSFVKFKERTFSVVSIGDDAFCDCNLLRYVEIPNSVTSIGRAAFMHCNRLTSLDIPNSVTSIGGFAFCGCSGLESIDIPGSVTKISEYMFWSCSSLKSILIPNTVNSIGDGAFEDCTSLLSIIIPNNVVQIGFEAFCGCCNLTSVLIPKPVYSIGNRAFKDCTNLKTITSLNPVPPRASDNTFEGVSKIECVIKVPEESVDAYKSDDYWKMFWDIYGIDVYHDESYGIKKCAEPVITLVDGEVVAFSKTEDAVCYTSITSDDFKGYNGNGPIALSGIYKITSYAHAEGYQNSETVTALLVWVNPTLEGNNILSMEAKKAVVIKTNGNNIQICGTEQGESIQLYSVSGMLLNATKAANDETTIPYNLQHGETYIIKYGDKSIKYQY